MSDESEDQRYEREELLPFAVEEVWRAITEPARLAAWLGDRVAVDLRPGGEIELGSAEGGDARSGFFEEIDHADRRLSFWWRAPDEEMSRVEIELREAGEGKTRLLVIESRPLAALDAGGSMIETWAAPSGPQMSAAPLVAA